MTAEQRYKLERSVTIRAERDVVFRYFTDSVRWASWWGAGSTIDARIGGDVLIRFPGGNEVVGDVVELHPPEMIAFTYGYVNGVPVARGESTVTIRLLPVAEGTLVQLVHAFADEAVMQQHLQGWRYQLSLFGNVVSDEMHAQSAAIVDQWFAMWSNPVAEARWRELERLATADISMRDRFSAIAGLTDVRAHLDAVHQFMPGYVLERDGPVRQCQGYVLANWKGAGSGGKAPVSGTSVFTLNGGGRIEAVTGFWTI